MATGATATTALSPENKRILISQINKEGGAKVVRAFLADLTNEIELKLKDAKKYARSSKWWKGPLPKNPNYGTHNSFWVNSGEMKKSSNILMGMGFRVRQGGSFVEQNVESTNSPASKLRAKFSGSISTDSMVRKIKYSNKNTEIIRFFYWLRSTAISKTSGQPYGEIQANDWVHNMSGKTIPAVPWLQESIKKKAFF